MDGSENVGMSNHNGSEILPHRKSEVSLAMLINQGLGDPKGKPKGEPDGQPVNIPALLHFFEKVTEVSSLCVLLDLHSYSEEQSKEREKFQLRLRRYK